MNGPLNDLSLENWVGTLAVGERVAASRLVDLACAILQRARVPAQAAQEVAALLVDAQLRGIDSHGLAHLPVYVARLLQGGIDPQGVAEVVHRGPSFAVVDGNNAMGVLVAAKALQTACDMALAAGIGACAVRNSNHFGAAAPLVERAARLGLVALAFSNAAPTMAPWGGKEPLLGTNPVSAAFPVTHGAPIVIDMATSAVARGRIRKAHLSGSPIPAHWALDAAGRPTTDPAVALAGTVQPLGGAKGYALALIVELLCTTLSGGRGGPDVLNPHNLLSQEAGTSHFFLAIDPGHFSGLDAAGGIAQALAQRIEASAPADAAPPRVPGRARIEEAGKRARDGIPVTRPLLAALESALRALPPARPGQAD